MKMKIMSRIKFSLRQVAIAIDQFVNACFGGWADETLSARAYRQGIENPNWRRVQGVIDAVFFWDYEVIGKNALVMRHCELSYLSELQRMQSPPEVR